MWFTDRGAAKQVGSVAPDGTVTLRPAGISATSSPGGVRTGSDGNLWFVDNGAPQALARYGVGAPAASVAPPAIAGDGGEGIAQSCAGATWSDWAGMQPSLTRFAYDGYRWQLDGAPIDGETEQSYTPTATDLGHTLTCSATVTYALFPVTVTAASAGVVVSDRTAPTLGLPESMVLDATGPGGATVIYTATSTDNVDASPAVSCGPASGGTFPIGTTTVSCTATDAAGNAATGTFTVVVRGADGQLADLAVAVRGVGQGKTLANAVERAELLLAHGGPRPACRALIAFEVEVAVQTALRKIARADGAALVADSRRIRAVLGC